MGKVAALILACGVAYAAGVSGIVVDVDGKPLSDVRIAHSAAGKFITKADGRFAKIGRPIVFRKPGYQSQFVGADAGPELRIVLREVAPHAMRRCGYPVCQSFHDSRFCLPSPPQMPVTDLGNRRIYAAKPGFGAITLTHGVDRMHDSVFIPIANLWGMAQVVETSFDNDAIVDARGQTKKGLYWRRLAGFGEVIAYSDADAAAAQVFDQMLDEVCLIQGRH